MAVIFTIPGPLREHSGDRAQIRIETASANLAEALQLLWREAPGVRDRVVTERGEVRPHVNIFVDGESIRYTGGLTTRLSHGSEVLILPALSGG